MTINDLYNIFLQYPSISIDTRKIKQNDLFFALKGKNFNGNKFAYEAIKSGAKYAIIDEKKYSIPKKTILVKNVLKTLQKLSLYHRENINTKIIGITGTNGKTTTKELIKTILSSKYKTQATISNFNNHIGVPLSLLKIKKDTQFAIIELGASSVGEIDFLCRIAKPDYGIITNIGIAHLENFGSIKNIQIAKTELYNYLKSKNNTVFVNIDDKFLFNASRNMNCIYYGTSKNAFIKGELVNTYSLFLEFFWQKNNEEKFFQKTNLIGKYNFYNVLASICIAAYFKVNNTQINKAIENYQPDNNRSQFKETKNNKIILDGYNANPTSMENAILHFLKSDIKNKVLILGDMLELGNYSDKGHKKIIELLLNKDYDFTILIGKNFHNCFKNFKNINKKNIISFQNIDKAKNWIEKNKFINKYILLKASRGLELENLLTLL